MSPDDFRAWQRVMEDAPVDINGDAAAADLAWRAMNAGIEAIERNDPPPIAQAADALGHWLAWSAFWLSLAAVLVAAIQQYAK